MGNLDPRIVAAIIAAITSVITLVLSLVFKSLFEKYFYEFKLGMEYKYEQRKKIKSILSKNKIQLLNSCESLNHRLWNFTAHYQDKWHFVSGQYSETNNYYFNSFVYRLMCVFAWIKKTEDEMVYLDTTTALREDMEFIKYLRILPQLFYDVALFKDLPYDDFYETDHFFRQNLEKMAQCLINGDAVCTYSQFELDLDKYAKELRTACRFIDGLSPDENRLRWDRLQLFHLTLIAFLNSFGYDFQVTSDDKIRNLLSRQRNNKLIDNYVELLERNKIVNQKAFKKIIKLVAN